MPARAKQPVRDVGEQVQEALHWLERKSTARDRQNLARFGIHAKQALGVSMANIQALGKRLGRDHDLAEALWATGCYEARLLASFVDRAELVTPAQMDRWCRDFDNWGVCDTVCFHLFDRTPHAWTRIAQWSRKKEEFGKRAAFALLASLAGHDKDTADQPFLESLELIEHAAADERNFVKKAVSWALRRIGWRNQALHAAAVMLARRLAESPHAGARWVGKDALRDITRPAVIRRVAARREGDS